MSSTLIITSLLVQIIELSRGCHFSLYSFQVLVFVSFDTFLDTYTPHVIT